LCLGEIFGVMQARAAQVDFCEIGAGEICVIKLGIAQICSAEVGLIKPRMHKIGAGHVGRFKIGCRQGREGQPRAAQVDFYEFGPSKIRVIKQGTAQICSAEVSVIKPGMHKISAGHFGSFKISR
jgi:hypothetical protein